MHVLMIATAMWAMRFRTTLTVFERWYFKLREDRCPTLDCHRLSPARATAACLGVADFASPSPAARGCPALPSTFGRNLLVTLFEDAWGFSNMGLQSVQEKRS